MNTSDEKKKSKILSLLAKPFRTKTFKDLIESKHLNNDRYPYCDSSISIINKIIKLFFILLIVNIFRFILLIIGNVWLDGFINKNEPLVIDLSFANLKPIELNIGSYIGKPFNFLINTLSLITKYSLWLVLILAVIYLILMVKRQRLYERNVLKNDIMAILFKKKIMDSCHINQLLKANQRILNASEANDTSLLTKKAKVESLRAIKNAKVFINTRESTEESEKLEKQCRVIFKLPFSSESRKDLIGTLKDFPTTLRDVSNDKFVFGEPQKSETRDSLIYRYVEDMLDPYIYEVIDANEKVILAQGNFPLALIKDRQKDLDTNKEKAKKWTKQIQRKVVSYMTTLDSAFKYITCEVGNATVSYKFQRQFDTKQSMNFETTAEQLGKNYSLGQVTMRVDGEGLLCIDVPLPKDLQVTINVPTLWRAVYGDPDPDWPDNFLNKE